MFYQNFSDLITKKISDRRPDSILLVFEISGEGPHFWWTGRENFFKHSSVANVSNAFMVTKARLPCQQWFLQAGRYAVNGKKPLRASVRFSIKHAGPRDG